MTTSTSRGLIKSMLIIGAAQAVNILISIVKMKVLAVLLGPNGIGILSIYTSLQGMAQQIAGLGMSNSAVREIASSREDAMTLDRVRRVLFAAHLIQGTLAMTGVWLLRERLAIWLFGDALRAMEVGLVGIAVLISLLAVAHSALLQGLRKIGDLGRITVFGAVVATLVGIIAVWLQGESGIIWFVIFQPLATFLIAYFYTRRLPKAKASVLSISETWSIWTSMAKLGSGFMIGGLITAATLLLVRSRIGQELGLDAAGHFAAAWGISMTYVGFLLGAMGADYYPRLTEIVQDRSAVTKLINDQTQLSLAIGGPVMLLLIGLGPQVIFLLYSEEFEPAISILQWQTFGNIFKLATWPLGFLVVAKARSITFLFLQTNWNVVFLVIIWPTLTFYGITVAGPAFAIACIAQLVVGAQIVRKLIDFRWQPLSLGLLGLHVGLAMSLLTLALTAPLTAAVTSVLLATATALLGLRMVLSKIGMHGRLPTLLHGVFERVGWPIRS